MWFHTNFFIPPKEFGCSKEEPIVQATQFNPNGEKTGARSTSFTFSGEDIR